MATNSATTPINRSDQFPHLFRSGLMTFLTDRMRWKWHPSLLGRSITASTLTLLECWGPRWETWRERPSCPNPRADVPEMWDHLRLFSQPTEPWKIMNRCSKLLHFGVVHYAVKANWNIIHFVFYSFIREIFIEYLLCTKHFSRLWNTALNKSDTDVLEHFQ